MIDQLALLPSRRAVRRLDIAATATAVVFVALGVLAGIELYRLAGLSSSLLDASVALDQVGRTLAILAQVPVVESAAAPLAESVRQTAASTRANALDAAAAVRVLAIVIGLAIALVPLPPLVAGYLPMRRARIREVSGLRRLLATGRPVDPMLVAHLAHGAVTRIPYAQLREISRDPWNDLAAGRHHRLAAAELRRLGVPPPVDWPSAIHLPDVDPAQR